MTCRRVLSVLAHMCSQKLPGQGCMALLPSLQASSWGHETTFKSAVDGPAAMDGQQCSCILSHQNCVL